MIIIILILILLPLLLLEPIIKTMIIIIHSYMHKTCEVITMPGQLDQFQINGLSELCTLYAIEPKFSVLCSRNFFKRHYSTISDTDKGTLLLMAI